MLRARPEGTKVQVIIPWHNTEASTVRAARSILSQTHKDLSLWIVCDGSDPSKLSTVEQGVGHDRRVRMLRLGSNHGPYLIHQAAAEATSAPFYAMQDSDDYSTEDRLEACLARKGDLVCCAFQDVQGGMTVAQSVERRPGQFSGQQFAAPLSPNHVGTWQTTSLLAIGGYWTGHRMASDTFAASLIWMCGRVEVTGKIGYIREIRPGSLTQHPSTGMGSPARKLARQELAQVWNRCLDEWRAVTSRGDTDPDLLASKIREIRRSKERADDRRRIENVRRALVELEASGVHDKTWTVNVETGAIAR
jgi:glycosyltransferase involved in cell wall biosynthesis